MCIKEQEDCTAKLQTLGISATKIASECVLKSPRYCKVLQLFLGGIDIWEQEDRLAQPQTLWTSLLQNFKFQFHVYKT